MRITRTANHIVLQLGRREHRLLQEILKLYPCVPAAHAKLSKSAADSEAQSNQRLLEEALAEQRAENKKHLGELLADPVRYKANEAGCRLTLTPAEVEWLLQILNDIRVGSWVALGSPDPINELALLNQSTAPHFWAMELSELFQQQLIEAVAEGSAPKDQPRGM